jgi:hopanoid biosynthesis associated protein HpnK
MKTSINTTTKRLIVNADDLGLTPGINRGVEKAFREGIVGSTSLLVNAPGFNDALSVIKDNPSLPVGIHLTLVGGDGPVTAPSRIPTLIDRGGRFFRSYGRFMMHYRRINFDEVRREFSAQIEKAMGAGIVPSHVDTHQHLHLLPRVADIVLDLCGQYRIAYVRCPRKRGGVEGPGIAALSHSLKKKIEKRQLTTTDHFAGFPESGKMTQKDMLNIIHRLKKGTTELMVHPGLDSSEAVSRYGWAMNWENELAALISPEVRAAVSDYGVELIDCRDV